MKSIKFKKNYYNGDILPYAVCYDATEFLIDNNEIYISVEREHYLSKEDGYTTQLLKGKALLKDVMYSFDKEEFIEMFNSIKDFIELNYKNEFFLNEVPHRLAYSTISIDNKEYKLGNRNLNDTNFNKKLEIVKKYCNILNLPSKLLKEVLNNKPFIK